MIMSVSLLFSCKSSSSSSYGYCVLGERYTGPGVESRLLSIKTTKSRDSILAGLNMKVKIRRIEGNSFKVSNGMAVSVLVHELDTTNLITAGIVDQKGTFFTLLEGGVYDIKFIFTGANTLTLKEVPFFSGKTNNIEVSLGTRGKEFMEYEVIVGNGQ